MACTVLISNYKNENIGEHLLNEVEFGTDTIYIASAYFNNYSVLEAVHSKVLSIKLVVLLDIGTSYHSLNKASKLPNVEIKFFTSNFHSKFYLIDEQKAVVGSANFTYSGLSSNEEIAILTSHNEVIQSLRKTFMRYWREAALLSCEVLSSFERFSRSSEVQESSGKAMFQAEVGNVFPQGINLMGQLKANSQKIQVKQREIISTSKMDPLKRDFVFFIMDNAEKYLKSKGGECRKEEFRRYIYESYPRPIQVEWESRTANTFGWAFRWLFELGITEESTGKRMYQLKNP